MSTDVQTSAELDAEVRRVIYDSFLSRARAVTQQEVARELSLPDDDVAASFGRLAAAHVVVLQPESGELLMANPFSAVPTTFRVSSGEKEWWANCIWDALGVLAMIDEDGAIETSCPDCGEALDLAVVSGQLSRPEGVVHFAVPAAHWWDDIVFT